MRIEECGPAAQGRVVDHTMPATRAGVPSESRRRRQRIGKGGQACHRVRCAATAHAATTTAPGSAKQVVVLEKELINREPAQAVSPSLSQQAGVEP